MPIAFARPPFNLPQAVIGVAYLPGGLGSLAFAPLSGWLTDHLACKYHSTAVRLVPGTLVSLTLLPAALVGFGWTLTAGSLAGVLAGGFLMGVGCSFAMPGLFGWLTIVQQGAAAAAMAGGQGVGGGPRWRGPRLWLGPAICLCGGRAGWWLVRCTSG